MTYDRAAIMRDAHKRFRDGKRLGLGWKFAQCLSTAWRAAKERQATRIRDRAIRRCGELLKQIEPGQGARDGKREVGDRPPLRKEVARNAGITPHQTKQAIRVANVPAEDFDRQVESELRHRL